MKNAWIKTGDRLPESKLPKDTPEYLKRQERMDVLVIRDREAIQAIARPFFKGFLFHPNDCLVSQPDFIFTHWQPIELPQNLKK
jgi:hypothetical protein